MACRRSHVRLGAHCANVVFIVSGLLHSTAEIDPPRHTPAPPARAAESARLTVRWAEVGLLPGVRPAPSAAFTSEFAMFRTMGIAPALAAVIA
jgi:hypothetical protein